LMPTYNYGQISLALKRSQFIQTATSKHQRWEKIDADGTGRRVILNANKLAPVPEQVLTRLLHCAGMDERELRKLLGFS